MALVDAWARSPQERAAASAIRRADDSLRDLARALESRGRQASRRGVRAAAHLPGVCGIFGIGLAADVSGPVSGARPDLYVRVLVDRSIAPSVESWAESAARRHFMNIGIATSLDEISAFMEVKVEPIDPPLSQPVRR